MNRRLFLLGAVPALTGCATIEGELVGAATWAGLTATDAAILFGIVRGLAEVAEIADPMLAPFIALAVAAMGPAMAKIEAGIASSADVAALVAQAGKLTIAGAPAVRIVQAVPAARG